MTETGTCDPGEGPDRPAGADQRRDALAGADEDLDVIVGPLLTLACELLERNDGLYPFGAVLLDTGELRMATPRGEGLFPQISTILDAVVEELRLAIEVGAPAVAVCADVVVRLPGEDADTEAVRVGVERPGRPARAYLLPYRRLEEGALRFDELVVAPAEPAVLAS